MGAFLAHHRGTHHDQNGAICVSAAPISQNVKMPSLPPERSRASRYGRHDDRMLDARRCVDAVFTSSLLRSVAGFAGTSAIPAFVHLAPTYAGCLQQYDMILMRGDACQSALMRVTHAANLMRRLTKRPSFTP